MTNFSFPYKITDLTHALDEGIPAWDLSCGFHKSTICDYADCATDVKFRVHKIVTPAGIGTHIDAPAHCISGGLTIDQLALQDLAAPCVVIDVSARAHERYSLSTQDIENFEALHGKILPKSFVIVRTGWEQFWNQPEKYHNQHVFPSVSREAAEFLLERDIAGLGIDTLSPDRPGDGPQDGYPVHGILLGAGKYIVENIAHAGELPPTGSFTLALPIKILGGTEAPLRLVGLCSR
jgi:kynurenine formamidase